MSRPLNRTAARLKLISPFAVAAGLMLIPTEVLSSPVKLSNSGVLSSAVEEAAISPDGRRVVYVQDAEIAGAYRIYSVPIEGGTPVALSPFPQTTWHIPSFVITPDSSRVVFRGFFDSASRMDLYSVPIAGPSSSRVVLATNSHGFSVTPNGSKVVFVKDFNYDSHYQVVSVPIQGPSTAAVALTGPPTPAASRIFGITPDSLRVVFEVTGGGAVKIMSVVIGSGPATAINLSPLVDDGSDSPAESFSFSPDGTRFVYSALGTFSGTYVRLYSVEVAGPSGSAIRLDSDTLRTSGVFDLNAASTKVVFTTSTSPGYVVVVDAAGPSSSAEIVSQLGGYIGKFRPGENTVVYSEDSGGVKRLFSLPVGSPISSRIELSRDPGTGAGVDFFVNEPHGRWVIYVGDHVYADWPMGFRSRFGVSPIQEDLRWTMPSITTYRSRKFAVTPSGAAAVIVGPAVTSPEPKRDRVWAVPFIGDPYTTGWILSPFAVSEAIELVEISSNGKYAVFIGDLETGGKMELFSAEIPVIFADDFETGDTTVW